MRGNRTQTVANHRDGARDVIWGVEVKRVVAAVISLLVAILGWSIVDRISMEHRTTALERQEFTPSQKQDLKEIVKTVVNEELRDYPTRAELERGRAEIAAKVVASDEETKRQLRDIRREFKDDASHNRAILEKLPGAREEDR